VARRSVQDEPLPAVFHERLRLTADGARLIIEQNFQLLDGAAEPIKHRYIWHRAC